MSNAFHLYRNGVEVTPKSEWSATWGEVAGGVANATVVVQNRDGDPDLDFHEVTGDGLTRDIIKMTYGPGDETDWVFYEGEVDTPTLELPVGFPFRRWGLSCTDWNTVPDLRLQNVPQGANWAVDPGGDADLPSGVPGGPYPVDPDAQVLSTDDATIASWYDKKVRAPDGGAFDTSTFVGEYVGPTHAAQLFDDVTGEPNYTPGMGPLKGAIAGLSALAAEPIYDWIDPDRKVHHTNIDDMPTCPVSVTDVRADWNGTTIVGGRGFRLVPSRTNAPEQAYIDGSTSFHKLAADDPDIGTYGAVLYQGTGWGHSDAETLGVDKTKRQILQSAQAVTRAQRDAVADAYTAYADRPRYQGEITIGGRDTLVDDAMVPEALVGVRAGQKIAVTDARLPEDLNSVAWPIQRLSGSLVSGRPDLFTLHLDIGDGPIQTFSAKLATHSALQRPPAKVQPRHVIFYQKLNPKPGEVQTLRSQALRNDEEPLQVAGVQVHWEFVSVTDALGDDMSGNGESLSPEDSVTNATGGTSCVFTAGSLEGVWYQIEASTPYQDL